MQNSSGYHDGVDFKFLKAMGITVKMYQPWQIGLFHEEIKGKFIWYPKKGTLMYEDVASGAIIKIGESGDFPASTPAEESLMGSTERVYEEIIKRTFVKYFNKE